MGVPAERFAEDGLRPLRAARFAAQLGFAIEEATAAAIGPALPTTARVSVERKTDELSRLLLAPHARRGLELLDHSGLLGVVLPDLAALSPRLRQHAVDVVEAVDRQLAVRLAALLHPLSLSGAPGSAAPRVRAILDAMRVAGSIRDEAVALVRENGCVLARSRPAPPADDAGARRWLARVGREGAGPLLALWEADLGCTLDRSAVRRQLEAFRLFRRRVRRVLRTRPPLVPSDLALDGRAVMDILQVPAGRERRAGPAPSARSGPGGSAAEYGSTPHVRATELVEAGAPEGTVMLPG